MRDAVIVEAVRTPIGKRNGALAGVHPVDLAALVLRELVTRTGVDPALIEDVHFGCVGQLGDQSSNVARFAILAAGWPEHVPGVTINRACGSSQQAIEYAAMAVLSGQQDLVVAGGVESMSRIPLGASRQSGEPYGATARDRYDGSDFNQITGAELIARRWGFGRRELDEFSALSHERGAAAIDAGAFDTQVVAVPTEAGPFTVDQGLRRGTTADTLAALKPVAGPDGLHHAGSSSQISDGAAALLITTSEKARELGLTPIARYVAGTVVGANPVEVLSGPIPATEKLLAKTGLSIDDIGAFEVNEAFASVPLAWLAETGADPKRVNPLGGAIALGHPLGASGAILMTRLINHLRDHGLRYGLQTMCEGGGTANATLVELLDA
ncbi:thiolase family protein [Pseudofrankia inefficax]|uniref:Acetyl-CoA acetyltransferase n=1 Tax=Pseudofrankia inefficax (strain DSM 45817 / CECT 9037 / DDB 130130 / EuI1c) TaxID=298654 RepID=E3J2K7_PSEI1|nr:acetyl-CoA C-acyltransferase [Pseudofrankia inefficax]ADP80521.1 acetyl-CoA acetyltransferase [Pseudofrankia inefficax]